MDNQSKICRICLMSPNIINCHFVNHNSSIFGTITLRAMLEQTIPELDIDITSNPVICDCCLSMLQTSYCFKMLCFQTGDKLYAHMEENNLCLGINKVNLNDLVNHTKTWSVVESILNPVETPPPRPLVIFMDNQDEDVQVSVECRQNMCTKPTTVLLGPDINKEVVPIETSSQSSVIIIDEDDQDEKVAVSKQCVKSPHVPKRKISYDNYLAKRYLKKNCKQRSRNDYQCYICGYKTILKRDLGRHMMTHTEENFHVCEVCKKGFIEPYLLRAHMFKHTGKT